MNSSTINTDSYICEIRRCHSDGIENICVVNSCDATRSELLGAIYLNEEDYRGGGCKKSCNE